MQLPLPFRATRPSRTTVLVIARRPYQVEFVRVRRARHYIVRLEDGDRVRVTIPWGGTRAEAERFVRERAAWIERQRYHKALERPPGPWTPGTEVLLRGEVCALEVIGRRDGVAVRLGRETIERPGAAPSDLRALVERHLRQVAERELPARLRELGDQHGFAAKGVRVGSQRSRWGSCSRTGRISLNWRLLQMPPEVRDYVLLHELVHLVHLDHSPRFWRELARVCPWHAEARAWIRRHHVQLG